MGPCICEHARIIVDHSANVEAGDSVVVSAPPAAEDLVTAIHELLGGHGANAVAIGVNPRFTRVFLRTSDGDYKTPEYVLALYEETDVITRVCGETNTAEQSDVSPEANTAYKCAYKPVQGETLLKR